MNSHQYKIRALENDTVVLARLFVSGAPMPKELANTALQTFDRTRVVTYHDVLQSMRQLLDRSEHSGTGDDVYIVKVDEPLTNVETATLVRYINICHHDRNIVVLNGEIVHVPAGYKDAKSADIQLYTHHVIRDFEIRQQKTLWRKLKTELFSGTPKAKLTLSH